MITLCTALFSFLFFSCVSFQDKNKTHENYYNEVLEQSQNTPFPNQNFLFLKKMIVDKNSGEEHGLSSASGIAFVNDKNTVYGLTAAHWCVDIAGEEFGNYVKYMLGYESIEEANKNIITKVDFYGKTYYMDILAIDEESDLCMLTFKSEHSKKVKKIKIAKKEPLVGDRIYTASAPQGISHHTIRLHFEGMYSGCVNPKECFFTIPGVFGSSGSGILNEDGDLVGILSFSIVNFHNVTGGPSLSEIREFVLTNYGWY